MRGLGLLPIRDDYPYEYDPGYSQESVVTTDVPWFERLVNMVGGVFQSSRGGQAPPPVAAPSGSVESMLPYLAIAAIGYLILRKK